MAAISSDPVVMEHFPAIQDLDNVTRGEGRRGNSYCHCYDASNLSIINME